MNLIFGFLILGYLGEAFPNLSVHLETGYHHSLGEVVLEPSHPHMIRVTEDRNRCTLDRFGEPEVCSQWKALSYDSRLQLINEREDQKVYAIVESENLQLVTNGQNVRLLTVNGDGNVTSAYRLKERSEVSEDR